MSEGLAGSLPIDWGPPHHLSTRAGFFMVRLLDGFENTAEHAAGRLPALVTQAGFSDVTVRQQWRTMWGSVELLTAERQREP